MKTAKDWLVPVVIIAVALGAFVLTNHSPRSAGSRSTDALAEAQQTDGAVAAPFTATTVDGKTVSLSDYKGKVLLIDFWASWCPPCREEAPNVVSAYHRYHTEGFDVLGVSLDQDKSAMSAFEKRIGMTWPQVSDADNGNAMAAKFNVQSIPSMLLVDGSTGRILAEDPRGEALEPAIRAALKSTHS